MDYMTTQEAAKLWGIKPRRVQYFCENGKIEAERLGHIWIIPRGTLRPIDGRTKLAKTQMEEINTDKEAVLDEILPVQDFKD